MRYQPDRTYSDAYVADRHLLMSPATPLPNGLFYPSLQYISGELSEDVAEIGRQLQACIDAARAIPLGSDEDMDEQPDVDEPNVAKHLGFRSYRRMTEHVLWVAVETPPPNKVLLTPSVHRGGRYYRVIKHKDELTLVSPDAATLGTAFLRALELCREEQVIHDELMS